MTIREYWTRRGAWLSLLWCVAAVNFFYCGYRSLHPHDPLLLYAIEALSVALAATHMVCLKRIPCPRCKKHMGLATTRPANRRLLGRPIHCRSCGVDIDEPLQPRAAAT
jgi:hypothetical protein